MKKIHYYKKKIGTGVLILAGLLILFTGIHTVFATTYTNLSPQAPTDGSVVDKLTFELYKCSKTALDAASSDIADYGDDYELDTSTDEGMINSCYVAYDNELVDFSTFKVGDNETVEPNSYIILVEKYDYEGATGNSIITSINQTSYYNSEQLELLYNSMDEVYGYYSLDWYPKKGKNSAYSYDIGAGTRSMVIGIDNGSGDKPLNNHQKIFIWGFKVKSDATPGSTLSFYLEGQAYFGAPDAEEGNKSDYSFSNIVAGNVSAISEPDLRVYVKANTATAKIAGATTSSDNTLMTLTTSSMGQNYAFDSTTPFTAGSKTVKTYLTYVPNSVADIDINATANDTQGSIAAGSSGKTLNADGDSSDRIFSSESNGLDVGMNTFTIAVTAPSGDVETYTLNVYRLSNDASITDLTASGITLTKESDTKYTGNTTYDDLDTNVNVTLKDQNATIASGTGLWTFTESGATPNTRVVTVQAENCQSKFASITGNSCTSANYTIEIMRTAASNVATLSDLKVDGVSIGTFTPSGKIYNYGNVANNKTSVTIAATLTDSTATIVSGTGTCELKVGDNTCEVKTLAQDGETEDSYKINIHRLSNDITLNSLTVSSNPNGTLTPGFTSANTTSEYTYTYDPTVTKVTVSSTVTDVGKAKIAIVDASTGIPATYTSSANTASAEFNTPDTTSVAIIVTAEDGTVHSFTVNLTRTQSTNNYLDSLTVKYTDGAEVTAPLTPAFSSTERNYNATIPATIDTVTINVTKASQFAKVTKIGTQTGTDLESATISGLDFGNNQIQITVLNEAGNDNTYTVTVEREKYSINTLDALNLGDGFTTSFASSTSSYTYDGTVPFTTDTLNLTGEKTNEYASVSAKLTDEKGADHTITITESSSDNTFSGTVNIPTGTSTVTVTVTAQDNTTKDYTISVTKAKNTDNEVKSITVADQVGEVTKDESDDSKYYVTLPYSKTTLQPAEVAIETSPDATLTKGSAVTDIPTSGEGKPFTFTIKSEDGTDKEYTLYVIRAANHEALITKVTLAIQGATLGATASCTMSSSEKTCTIGVPTSTTGFIDTVEMSDGATIVPDDGTAYAMAATESTKELTYVITSEDTQVTETYVITVERQQSSVNTLSDLQVSGVTVSSFNPGNNVYTNTQAGTVESVEVKAIVTETGKASVSRATVNGTEVTVSGEIANGEYTFNADLNFGDNAVVITVQAENGQTQNYNLTITRQQRNNALQDSIKYRTSSEASFELIQGYVPATGSYTLPTVDYEVTSIEFEVTPQDEFGSAIITSVTDEDGTITATNIADTNSDDENVYTGSVNLSTGKNVIVITGTAHNGTTTKTYTLTINRRKNEDNSFSELKVKGKDATPVAGEEDTYEVELSNENTSLNTATDVTLTLPAGAEVSFSPQTINPLSTADEGNTITMTVTSEDGTGKVYTLIVKRTKSSSTSLSGATVTISSPVDTENGNTLYCYFTSTTECVLNVPTSTNGFTLELAGDALEAGSTDPDTPKEYEMPATQSTIEIPITVTAEDGTENTDYKVTINRAKSGNNNLSDISYRIKETDSWKTVTGFIPSTNLYRIEVEGDVDEIYLNATVQDTGKATIVTDLSNAFALAFGQQQIEIKVKAENDNITNYYVIVTRKRKTDAHLKSIKIDGVYIVEFNENVFDYILPDVDYSKTSMEIEAELHDNDPDTEASISGPGTKSAVSQYISKFNVDLNTDNNTLDLIVTADDKTTTEKYTIHVKRAKNNSTAVDAITIAGVNATYNETDGVWEATVPNAVDKANTTNVVVTPAPGATERDALATTTLTETELSTKNPTDVTIFVTAEDGTTGTQTLRVTRTKSNVSTLHTLTVQGGSFSPSFVQDSKDTLRYTVTIPETTDKVIINATPTDENATIIGLGEFTFSANATFPVNVTSEDGSDTTAYYLDVVRSTSSVNTLKSITVSSGTTLGGDYTEYTLVSTEDGTSEGFSPEITAYTVTIPGNISKINIDAETSDPRAQITNALTALGEKTILVGTHTVTIRVQAESGAGQSYILTITRLPKPFNLLTDLTVNDDTIAGFSPDVNDYTLDDVENDVASIVIGGTKEDADSSVTGFGTCDLKVGENTCKVTVTAQNGDKNEYRVKVNRKASDENRLSMLTVNGYSLSPAFNPDTDEYTVTVKATKTKLSPSDVTAIAKDSTATIVKDPELTLVTNEYSVYKVAVTSASGKEKIYSIRVFKPKSSDATISSINLTNASLSGSIQKNVFEYTIYVPHGVATFSIEGIPTVETTTVISGNDTYTLADTSQVTIITLAEDGTTSLTYTFNVEESLSNDATLSGLMVLGYPYVGTYTTFSPAITTYSIGDIDYSVNGLTIQATATNTTSSIKYYVNGVLQTSNVVEIPPGVGSGSITVHSVAADGITYKDYTISYNKTYSTNAYLAHMSSNVGTFTTDFIKTNTSYVLLVDESVTEVKFTLYTESANAFMIINSGDPQQGTEITPYEYTMTGIETGDNPLSILVQPQDSDAEGKNYNVVVRKSEPAANSDATLESLSIDDYPFVSQAGYTTTTFEKDVTDYHIGTVNLKVDKFKVNYSPTQSGATTSILVGGVKVTPNEDGYIEIPTSETNTGVVTVQVVAPNGTTTKNYNIHYNKVASSNAFLASIVVSNGTLSPDFYKETTEYTDTVSEDTMSETITITPEVTTSTIVVGGGLAGVTYTTFPAVHSITGLTAGTKEVPITVTAENGNVVYYYVNIFKEGAGELITSDTYGHVIENGYITSVSPGVDADTFKGQLDNDNVKLKIFKDDGTGNAGDELGAGELVGTGMIVKLFINGVENDSKVIVIKGDVSGDGEITITDVVKVLNHYLGNLAVTGAYLEAAEVSDDNEITITDVVKILNHYLGNLTLAYHK